MDDERTLIQRSQQGDERAFATLIRGYEGRLSTLIRYTLDGDADHDEVMQDTLMAAWRSLPALRELDRFAPWLFAIARNRLRDATRAWTRRDTPTADGTLNALVGHTTVGHQGTLGSSDLRDAVRALPHARRHVTRLFYVEGLTIAEIAGRRGSPVGTVKRQLFESRRQLRRSFGIHVAGTHPWERPRRIAFPPTARTSP